MKIIFSFLEYIIKDMSKSTLTFSNGDTKLDIDYDLLFAMSKLVATMAEDDPQEREIIIPSFSAYLQDDVNAHLQHILRKISTLTVDDINTENKKDILKEDVYTYTRNPLDIGKSRVVGTIDNLILYFLLINWLDIPLLYDEVYESILEYVPPIVDISKYMNILESILRNPKLVTQFLKLVLQSFLQNDEPLPEYTSLIPIMNKIVHHSNIDLYTRYLLHLKYQLYGVDVPWDTIDILTARQLYLLNTNDIPIPSSILNNISQVLSDEIGIIDATLDSVVDSITLYDSVMRVNFPNSPVINSTRSDTRGYFMFYVHSIPEHNKIHVGNVNIDGKIHKVVIEDRSLYPVEDFISGKLINGGDIDYSNHAEYSKIYNIDIKTLLFQSYKRTDKYQAIAILLREDTRFRKWLLSQSLLSDFEKSMLSHRDTIFDTLVQIIEAKKEGSRINEINDDVDLPDQNHEYVHLLPPGENMEDLIERIMSANNIKITNLTRDLEEKILQLLPLEKDFYFSEEGKKLENARLEMRKHFYSTKLYQGIVIVCNVYEIIDVEGEEIKIMINSHLLENGFNPEYEQLYHTINIPKFVASVYSLQFPDMEIMAGYKLLLAEKDIKIMYHFYSYTNIKLNRTNSHSFYDPDHKTSFLIQSRELKKGDIVRQVTTRQLCDVNYNNDVIFPIVDPSLIPNIQQVITESQQPSNFTSKILAYPPSECRMFVMAYSRGNYKNIRLSHKIGKVYTTDDNVAS
jgi:hypothetical protein